MGQFGEMVRERRKELRLGLRECALRADINAGNLSKIERGRLSAPQDTDLLDRLCLALEYEIGSSEADALRDIAATENGRIPPEVLEDEGIMSRMPVLLRTVHNKQLEPEQIDELIELIRNA